MSTHRVVAETLALFYAAGGVLGFLMTAGDTGGLPTLLVGSVLSTSSLLVAGALVRWGPRWPRRRFHACTAVVTVSTAVGVAVATSTLAAAVLAASGAWIGVQAHFCYGRVAAHAHVGAAVVLTTTALLWRGDVPLTAALSMNVVVFTLGAVTRRLVRRASDATRDPLTGLVNRRGFDEQLQQLSAAPDVLSAALIDLDHFKLVNDTLGHEAGDRVLCRVAEEWQRGLPREAVLARHGGDEFALLLPGTTGPVALELVRRLAAGHPDVRLSIGVAQAHHGETAAQLMRRADTALYRAKDAGRGRCVLQGEDRGARRPAPLAATPVRPHTEPVA